MLIFSMVDFFKAIVLLFVIEGIIYFLFHIRS